MNHNNFSVLRLSLALMVVLGHFKTLPGNYAAATGLFGYADFAVDAFFVVSGYLVTASLDKQPQTLGFYIRRFCRVYPLYITVVLAQALAMLMLLPGSFADYVTNTARYLAVNAVFANFLQYDIGGLLKPLHNPGINPSLWTLKIEVGFYLLLPALWWAWRRFGVSVLVAAYIASAALALYAAHHGMESFAKQLPCQLRYFIIGIACYLYGAKLRLKPWQLWLLTLGLLVVCSFRHELPFYRIYYPVAAGLLVYLVAVRLPALPLRFDISYGVYLFHAPLIQLALLLGWYSDSPQFLAILLTVVILAAFVAEWLIEKPGIALGKHLVKLLERKWPPSTKEQGPTP